MTKYHVPRGVAHVVPDDEPDPPTKVFLMHLPDGPPVVLNDSAALIWLVAAEGEEDVAGAIGELVGRDAHEISADVTTFLRDLVAQGFLETDGA